MQTQSHHPANSSMCVTKVQMVDFQGGGSSQWSNQGFDECQLIAHSHNWNTTIF